jgi:hypothetical protein
MPVSKKRKKDGKPVHRKTVAPAPDADHPHVPETGPAPAGPRPMMGRPANPFIAQQQSRRGSQRGR